MNGPCHLPSHPQTQALSSKTFSPPPLDGSLTLPELYEWHLKNTPNHRLFVFSREHGEPRTILWPEAVRAVRTGARLVRHAMGWKSGMKDVPVVAILAASDTFSYFTMTMAIIRAGYIAFPISPRNSPAAVAHLIAKVQVKHVFVGHEQTMIDLGKEALEILKTQNPNISELKFSPIPLFNELFLDSQVDPDDIPFEKRGPHEIVTYLHSSGSTAFPKPIAWTNHRFAQLALIPYFGERDLTDVVWSLHTMPMYHAMGVLQLCWTASCGLVVNAFEPKSPAHIPTPRSHFEAAVASSSDIIFCVPAVIEEWSRRPDYVKWLATRTGVLFGGGPLNKKAGDYLTSQGVRIFIMYGSTEGGIMSPILPAEVGYDWDYFKFPGNVAPEMVPYGNGTYEFVMITNPFCRPSVINTQINGIDSYATSDLFTAHPQKPGYWRVYGRNDDQIMHNTGEKTNPGPLENILNQDPQVQSSVMFGRGEFQAGVIIDLKAEFKFNPTDEKKLAEFRNKIWPTVQQMNAIAPQHSRLFKEMITIPKPSKPFQYTAKSTPRRQAIINDYAEEIKALYDAVADSAQSSIPPPAAWDFVSTLDFVRLVVNKVLLHNVTDNEDIFQHGCDSLQATWIRNSLLRALRDTAEIDTRHMVDNFVYDHTTISTMASFLSALATGATTESQSSPALRATAMRKMVEKYTIHGFPEPLKSSRPNGSTETQGDIVLVTGTTGALGTYLLAGLVEDPSISRIYALNRSHLSATSTLEERQEKGLLERGVKASAILGAGKVRLLEADLTLPSFGLSDDVYKEMKGSVTHIIHSAWPVDFNLMLSSFDRNVHGLRNLIDFALTSLCPSPPTLIYTSTIGVFQNVESIQALSLPENPIPPEVAVGNGYTESKWVSEGLLIRASSASGLNSIIVRVGQLAGGLNGFWSTNEWLPALVQSGQVCGCLPVDDKNVSWIPLHIAAKSLIALRASGSGASSTIIHLIHPHPISWSSLVTFIAADLSIPLVPFAQWLAELEQSGGTSGATSHFDINELHNTPALRLLPFFRSISEKAEQSANALGFPRLACDKITHLLNASDIPVLDENDVRLWLGYWRRVGFMKE